MYLTALPDYSMICHHVLSLYENCALIRSQEGYVSSGLPLSSSDQLAFPSMVSRVDVANPPRRLRGFFFHFFFSQYLASGSWLVGRGSFDVSVLALVGSP